MNETQIHEKNLMDFGPLKIKIEGLLSLREILLLETNNNELFT